MHDYFLAFMDICVKRYVKHYVVRKCIYMYSITTNEVALLAKRLYRA